MDNIRKFRKNFLLNNLLKNIDLKNGLLFGVFQKEDVRKNLITVFTKDNISKYLESKLVGNVDLRLGFITILDEFYSGLEKTWFGIPSYREMIDAKFNNASPARIAIASP